MSELDDIRARRDAVTPGVWSASWAWGKSGEVYNAWAEAPFTSGTCLEDVAPQAEADATFIAAAPADIDTLLAMVDALTGERDALAAQLEQAQQELASGKPVPSQSENAAAEARIKRIDELYVRYSLGGCYAVSEWPEYAQHEFDRLDKAQREYEAKYC